jgi:putative ABC transport system permease protein
MAVGAQQGDVVWMILREALLLVGAGVAIGVPAAWAAARMVSSRVSGLDVVDPLPMMIAIGVLAAMAGVASYVPARRASRADPMVALRNE